MNNKLHFDLIQKELDFYLRLKKNHDSLWSKRLSIWIKKIVDENGKVRKDVLINFRKYSTLLSEIPNSKKNYFFNLIYQFVRASGNRYSAEETLNNFKSSSNYSNLKNTKLSLVGNPGFYYTKEGYIYNERFLRHLRNIENIENKILIKNNPILKIVDIGGGYCQFGEMIKRKIGNVKVTTVDFYEQLILGYFYLLENFPKVKICPMSKIMSTEKIDNNFINSYDFVLIPVEYFKKIEKCDFDLLTNFSSFGEMPNAVFKEYLSSDIFKKINFFYTVNRLDSWPDYNNGISVIDYLVDRFQPIHFKVSPIWTNYYVSYTSFFKPIKKAFKSRNFEFIGKSENR